MNVAEVSWQNKIEVNNRKGRALSDLLPLGNFFPGPDGEICHIFLHF